MANRQAKASTILSSGKIIKIMETYWSPKSSVFKKLKQLICPFGNYNWCRRFDMLTKGSVCWSNDTKSCQRKWSSQHCNTHPVYLRVSMCPCESPCICARPVRLSVTCILWIWKIEDEFWNYLSDLVCRVRACSSCCCWILVNTSEHYSVSSLDGGVVCIVFDFEPLRPCISSVSLSTL